MAAGKKLNTRRTVLLGLTSAAAGNIVIGGTENANAVGKPMEGGDEVPPEMLADGARRVTTGESIAISFDPDLCIHARFCVLWEPRVFIAREGPWIEPDRGTTETTAATIRNCPSGALQYIRRDQGPGEQPPMINVLYLRENGPLAFRGSLSLYGRSIGYRATLCRCGKSAKMPYCDRSHNVTNFQSTGEAPSVDSPKLAQRGGSIEIVPIRDGPLVVDGNIEICSGTGRTIKRSAGDVLCRCGQSKSKPFCDGSHIVTNFRADGQG